MFRNLRWNHFDAGFDIGFKYMGNSYKSPADWFMTVSVTGTAGYSFPLSRVFYLRPQLSLGGTAGILRYDPDGYVIGGEEPEFKNAWAMYGIAAPGLVAGIRMNRLFLEAGIQYEFIFGTGKPVMILPLWLSVSRLLN